MTINILRVLEKFSGGLQADLESIDSILLNEEKINSIHLLEDGSVTGENNSGGSIYKNNYVLPKTLTPVKYLQNLMYLKEINLVHLHAPYAPVGIVTALACIKEKVPLIVTYHGGKTGNLSRDLSLKLTSFLPNYVAKQKLVISDAARYLMGSDAELINVPVDNYFSRKNKTDYFESYKSGDDDKILFYPARITPDKGQLDLVNCMAKINGDIKDNYYVILAGDVDSEDYFNILVDSIKRFSLADNFSIVGRISKEDMPKAYNGSDLVVFPTYTEGFGRIIVEGGLCGVPTIAYNVGGIPEVINHNNNGVLVEVGNVNQLGNEILKLLNFPENLKYLGDNAEQNFKSKFDSVSVAQKHLEIYQEIVFGNK